MSEKKTVKIPIEPGWDFDTDPLNPQPLIYPVCAICGDAYEYRRALSLATGDYFWAWFAPPKQPRMCRHNRGMVKNTEWHHAPE